jgi:F-type H+-transporting ATPase subunit b
MMQFIQNFGATEAAHEVTEVATEKGFFEVLGVDWRLLVLNLLAFIILVWILSKFVYPPLVKAIDSREKAIEASVKAAEQAEARAEATQKEINELFEKARTEATEIVEIAHKEAANSVKEAEDKAKTRADQIIVDARTQLEADVLKARKALKQEAIELVVAATEKVVGEKLDASADKDRIKNALASEERA